MKNNIQTGFTKIKCAAIIPIIALGIHANAQNIVSGNIQTIPTKTTPTEARVTFSNASGTYSQYTTNGNYSINIPSGTYQREVLVPEHYRVMDTIAITSSQVINEKTIKDSPVQSEIYNNWGSSILLITKVLTSTFDGNPNGNILHRANTGQFKYYPREYSASDPLSMPQILQAYLDSALTDITTKTGGIITYTKQSTEITDGIGISFVYPKNHDMPIGGVGALGFTDVDENFVKIYINRDLLPINTAKKTTFERELLRAMLLQSNGADVKYIMYHGRAPVYGGVTPDEANVIKIMFTLDNYTDMHKHRDEVVSSITNTAPGAWSFDNSIDGAAIKYNVGTIDIKYDAKAQDADHDKVTTNIHIYSINGTGTDTTITTSGNLGEIIIPAKKLKPATYKIEGTATDGILTTNATNAPTFGILNDTGTDEIVNEEFKIYPNPATGTSTISYSLAAKSSVRLLLYDNTGRLIEKLVDAPQQKGQHCVTLNNPNLVNGTYFLSLGISTSAGEKFAETRKMILAK